MRQFRTLFRVDEDADAGVLYISGEKGTHDYPSLMVSREGSYVPISVSYGPIELALRLTYDDLAQALTRLQPVDGLQTTRQVGSANAYLAMGLRSDGVLLMRPTMVGDASGHMSVNLALPSEVRESLMRWLGIGELT
ncbi:MAG: hypothetical protein AAF125_16160 [Chloroflexota bacterium]